MKTTINYQLRMLNCFRRYMLLFVMLAAVFCFLIPPANGSFEDIGVGARGTGLSNALTALADDAYSLHYNPAGLARVGWQELALDYESLYFGLDDNSMLGSGFVGYAHSLKDWGTLGVGWLNFSLSNYYNEDTIIIGFGKQILYLEDSLPELLRPALSRFGDGSLKIGFNLKLLSKSYKSTLYTENAVNLDTGYSRNGIDPVFSNGYSKRGLSLDFGMIYDFDNHHSAGIVLNDINKPDMGLAGEDDVNSTLKIGYGYRGRNVNVDTDLSFKQNNYTFSAGAEKWFMSRTFAGRAGIAVGNGDYANLSFGGSYMYNEVSQFDYSFRYPLRGVASFYGSHQISFTMKFGPVLTKEESMEEEIQRLRITLEKTNQDMETAKGQLKEKEDIVKNMEELKEKVASAEDSRKKQIRQNWELGMRYYKDEKYSDAISKFEEILKLDPGHQQSLKAIEKCNQGIKINKAKLIKQYWYAGTYYYKQAQYEKAISEFTKILEIDPGHQQSLKLVSQSKDKMQKGKKSTDKQQVEKHYTAGLKAYQSGNLEKAIDEWSIAHELDPDNEEINNMLERTQKEIQLKKGR